MKLNYLIIYLYFAIASFSGKAIAADLKFITLNVPPWASYDKSTGEYIGMFPDIVREVQEITGYTIKITLIDFSFQRMNKELSLGRQDCAVSISEKERVGIATIEESIFDLPMGVIPRKGIELSNYSDLEGISISVVKVLSEKGKFMSDPQLDKKFDIDYQTGLRKIERARVDSIAGAIPTIMFLSEKFNISNVLGKPLLLDTDPIYLQCANSSKKTVYIEKVNQAIRYMKKNAIIDTIASKNKMAY